MVDKHAMFYSTEGLYLRESKLDQVKKHLMVLQEKDLLPKPPQVKVVKGQAGQGERTVPHE